MLSAMKSTALLFLLCAPAWAGPSPRCESISDTNDRALCRAVTAHDASLCGSIQPAQAYRACAAIISGRTADAQAIDNLNLRRFLESTARDR